MLFKNICLVTANRSDYSKVRGLVKRLSADPDVNLTVYASGTMSSKVHGYGVQDVINDGITPYIEEYFGHSESIYGMSKSVGLQIMDISSYIKINQFDCLIITGDRWDILPAALSFSLSNIPIIHIQGGEVTGTIDNVIRDVITKLSHIHLTATQAACERVRRLGEDHVYCVGCPSIDFLQSLNVGIDVNMEMLLPYIKDEFSISKKDQYLLIMIHPNVTNKNDVNIESICNALFRFPNKKIWFYPNNDPYHESILNAMRRRRDKMIKFSHLPMECFAMLMAHASCMIGNSSAGIREAASFGTPVVNIGNRQQGRERNANTIDCDCEEQNIYNTVNSVLGTSYPKNNLYGDGKSINRMIEIIKSYSEIKCKNVEA